MNCECGGKLIFEHQNDGQFMGGYVYSYKCDKCKMLHFFKHNVDYYEDRTGVKKETPKSATQ